MTEAQHDTVQEQKFSEWHDQTYGVEARNSVMREERKMIFFAGWEAGLPYMFEALQDGVAMIGRGISAQTGKSVGIWSRLRLLGAPRRRADG